MQLFGKRNKLAFGAAISKGSGEESDLQRRVCVVPATLALRKTN
jgi:hypothetical protein